MGPLGSCHIALPSRDLIFHTQGEWVLTTTKGCNALEDPSVITAANPKKFETKESRHCKELNYQLCVALPKPKS